MRISILGSRGFADNCLVSATMEDFICETQCYLFTVVCGNTEKKLSESIGKIWAENNGAPIEYIFDRNIDKLIQKMVDNIDFAILFYDGKDAIIRKIIMKMKMSGKHGKVIKIGGK